jgi:hypothetical protein
VSITAWTVVIVIAVVALVVVIKLAILALVVKREEIRSIHQHPDGTCDDDDVVKSRRERRE